MKKKEKEKKLEKELDCTNSKFVKVIKDETTGTTLYKLGDKYMVSNQNTWKQWKAWKAQKEINEKVESPPKHITSYKLESRKDNEELARMLQLDKQAYELDHNFEFTLQPEDKCNVNKFDGMLNQRIHYGDQGHYGCIKRGYHSACKIPSTNYDKQDFIDRMKIGFGSGVKYRKPQEFPELPTVANLHENDVNPYTIHFINRAIVSILSNLNSYTSNL